MGFMKSLGRGVDAGVQNYVRQRLMAQQREDALTQREEEKRRYEEQKLEREKQLGHQQSLTGLRTLLTAGAPIEAVIAAADNAVGVGALPDIDFPMIPPPIVDTPEGEASHAEGYDRYSAPIRPEQTAKTGLGAAIGVGMGTRKPKGTFQQHDGDLVRINDDGSVAVVREGSEDPTKFQAIKIGDRYYGFNSSTNEATLIEAGDGVEAKDDIDRIYENLQATPEAQRQALYNKYSVETREQLDARYKVSSTFPKGKDAITMRKAVVATPASQVLVDARKMILDPEYNQYMGPIMGRTLGQDPWNTKARDFDAAMQLATQMAGKFLEGGVLRKEDTEKYRKMLPQLSDTPAVAKLKIARMEKLVKNIQKIYMQGGVEIITTDEGFTELQVPNVPFNPSRVPIAELESWLLQHGQDHEYGSELAELYHARKEAEVSYGEDE